MFLPDIIRARQNDLEKILSLQKITFLSEAKLYNDYKIGPLTQTYNEILEDFDHCIFLKAVYRDCIIGSVRARQQQECCWVGKLNVSPEYQNRGIGRRLLLEIENYFTGINQFVLYTGARSMNNIRLYKSAGYKVKETFFEAERPGLELIKMIKEL